jgi:hypothetical protein
VASHHVLVGAILADEGLHHEGPCWRQCMQMQNGGQGP